MSPGSMRQHKSVSERVDWKFRVDPALWNDGAFDVNYLDTKRERWNGYTHEIQTAGAKTKWDIPMSQRLEKNSKFQGSIIKSHSVINELNGRWDQDEW